MLRNLLIKHHHAFLRTAYTLTYTVVCTQPKLEGSRKGAQTFRSLHALKSAGKSCVTFYTDIRTPLHSVIRELILPHAQSPYNLGDIIDELNIPLSFVAPLEKLLAKPSLLSHMLHGDNNLVQMLTSSQSMTWFQAPGHDQVALSATGCGPGDPLVDIMYNVVMIPVMNEITDTLVLNNFHITWPTRHSSPFWQFCNENRNSALFEHPQHCISTDYVDDFAAIAQIDISATDDIIENVQVIPRIVSNSMHSRGMCINDIKSGIMTTISGPCSCKAKSLLADLEYLVIHGNRIPVISCYNHLGCIIDKDACTDPETKSRGKMLVHLLPLFATISCPKLLSQSAKTPQWWMPFLFPLLCTMLTHGVT